ncbi:IS1182 family transposase [Allorhodopirellula solitaria]|uniref:Transposase DDE domain protein n=1 Tax=Allorhodopirellula solitaria TaxID=2527987 RepID=A0A5C5XXS4_9BACT|nr:IS1182 family transposase [Allorhodopirellula solitaria]TWT66372.1 Transposase DDE domain protein [Allorhodopirellula solitaria]
MVKFSMPPLARDQLVLFPERLDQAIPADHSVRLLDDILGRLSWNQWEQKYNGRIGQPPIHPRVLASVILYGLLCRIRTSRSLEEALIVRVDFRWLVEGRTIDHTTISEFRRKNSDALKDIFVQIALVARDLGHLPLKSLAFDGTRIRANNRKSGTRTPEELRKAKKELAAKFVELEARTAEADSKEDEQLGAENAHQLQEELADVKQRRERVDAALAEIDRLESEGKKVPARIPITDPESRVTPNKEGGCAPNYTPHATVDVDSGFIVSEGVIAEANEDKEMFGAVEDVKESFGLEEPPAEMLADGLMSTGENLAKCEEAGIDLYSPIKGAGEDNPAIRPDPSEPVASSDLDRLPTTTTKKKDGTKTTKFSKAAFVYDAEADCYRCPAGKAMPYANKTSQVENGRKRIKYRYKADASDCAGCPLAERCFSGQAKSRQISHEQHEAERIAHAKKMGTESAKTKYSRRRHPSERPFAMIKGHFGARRFLTRGLKRVGNEWRWLCTAFNLHRLLSLIASGTDPPALKPTT